jgi:hypothetical protein
VKPAAHFATVLAVAVAFVATAAGAPRIQIVVRTSRELTAALARAKPGTTIALAAGVYQGGIFASDIAGTPGAPIVIEAADPARLPVVRGSGHGLQFTRVRHVTVRRIVFEDQRDNGINIDDGGAFETPSQHITLSELTVRNVLNTGIAAGIKLSGVQDFVIENSTIADWGGGSAITMIGAHRGIIRGNVFRHRDDVGATGPQMKGGSTGIVVRGNRFEHAGLRAVQIGGATGAEFFRPQPPRGYEARDCVVEHNVFVGSEAVVAFANVDGSTFRHNTVYRPRKWLLRILQEVSTPGFVPSRRGIVTDNLIYYHVDDFPAGATNVGAGTDGGSFRFARNWWYRADRPEASRQPLPSDETAGVYGRNPMFVDTSAGDFRLTRASPAVGYGALASPGFPRLPGR